MHLTETKVDWNSLTVVSLHSCLLILARVLFLWYLSFLLPPTYNMLCSQLVVKSLHSWLLDFFFLTEMCA